jgi:hypothetical protein
MVTRVALYYSRQIYLISETRCKNSVPVSQNIHCFSMTETNRLMLLREIITVCCENHQAGWCSGKALVLYSEVLGSSLGRTQVVLIENFLEFSQSLCANAGRVPWLGHSPFHVINHLTIWRYMVKMPRPAQNIPVTSWESCRSLRYALWAKCAVWKSLSRW